MPEVQPLLPDDPLALVELEVVASVDLFATEVAVDREHPERGSRVPREVAGRDRGRLRAEHRADGDPDVVRARPPRPEGRGRTGERSALVDRGDAGEEVRRGRLSLDPLDRERIVDRPRRVVLRHEQRVVVPELGLEERAFGLLEAEPDQDLLELLEPRDVRVWSCPREIRHGRPDVVGPERAAPPAPRTQEVGGERAEKLLPFGGDRKAATLLRGGPALDRPMVATHKAAPLERVDDRRIDIGRCLRYLPQHGLFRKESFLDPRVVLQPEGGPFGEESSPAEDPDGGGPLFLVESRRRHFVRGQRAAVARERVEEPAFGKPAGERPFPLRGKPEDRLVLFLDESEVLRAEALQASPHLVGR